MLSNSSAPQAQPKPAQTSPFFMFLSDQQKSMKAQNANIKLLDLASNAIKEWDQVTSIRDEYTAKSLGNGSPLFPKAHQSLFQIPSQPKRQPMLHFDSRGKPVPPTKRNLTAFICFREDNYSQIMKDNPTLKSLEIANLIMEKWENADKQTKDYYEAKKQEAQEFYEQQKKLFYESTHGTRFQTSRRPATLFGSRK